MINIKSQLKAMKVDLNRMHIKNSQATSYEALSIDMIRALEKKHKCLLPDEIRDYYLEVNGQYIFWSTPDGIVAHSVVLDVKAFLTGRISAYYDGIIRVDAPFYSKYLDVNQKRLLDGYWVFERMYADNFVLIPKEAHSSDVSLFLLEYPFKLTRLDLSFSAYLEQLFANKALLNWQQQYKEKDKNDDLSANFERSVELTATLATKAQPPAKRSPFAYQERLNDLIKRVKSNPKLNLLQVDRYPPPPVNAFQKIEKTFQRKLPNAMVDFYSQVNGFKLIWHTKPGVLPATFGKIDIMPLELAFGGEHYMLAIDWDEFATYKTLWDDTLKEAVPDDFLALKNKRVFDRHLGRNQVLIEITDEGVDFFYYVDGGVSKLKVKFDELMDMVFNTGGTEYYPELLGSGALDIQFLREMEEKVRIINPKFQIPIRR